MAWWTWTCSYCLWAILPWWHAWATCMCYQLLLQLMIFSSGVTVWSQCSSLQAHPWDHHEPQENTLMIMHLLCTPFASEKSSLSPKKYSKAMIFHLRRVYMCCLAYTWCWCCSERVSIIFCNCIGASCRGLVRMVTRGLWSVSTVIDLPYTVVKFLAGKQLRVLSWFEQSSSL